MLNKLMSTQNSWGLLFARLILGFVMFPHGAQKVFGWFGGYGFSGTMGFFTEKLGVPFVFALLAILAEFLGSIGLVVGLFSRVAAFGIFSVMAVAIFKVHLSQGFFMNWSGSQGGEGFEYHLLAIGLCCVIMAQGSGALSLDRKWSRSR